MAIMLKPCLKINQSAFIKKSFYSQLLNVDIRTKKTHRSDPAKMYCGV